MNKYDNYFEEIYGAGTEMIVTTKHGNTISGIMYCDDKTFRILVSDNQVFFCFYLDQLNYEYPYSVDNVTDQYEGLVK